MPLTLYEHRMIRSVVPSLFQNNDIHGIVEILNNPYTSDIVLENTLTFMRDYLARTGLIGARALLVGGVLGCNARLRNSRNHDVRILWEQVAEYFESILYWLSWISKLESMLVFWFILHSSDFAFCILHFLFFWFCKTSKWGTYSISHNCLQFNTIYSALS